MGSPIMSGTGVRPGSRPHCRSPSPERRNPLFQAPYGFTTRTHTVPATPSLSPHSQLRISASTVGSLPPLVGHDDNPLLTSTITVQPSSPPRRAIFPSPSRSPPPRLRSMTAEENVFIYQHLPMRSRATPETVIRHFQRRGFLYLDLAEATDARLATMQLSQAGRVRRARIADLARGIGDKWERRRRLRLPYNAIQEILERHREEKRLSVFWTKVIDEVEKADTCYVIASRTLVLLFVQFLVITALLDFSPRKIYLRTGLLLLNSLVLFWVSRNSTIAVHEAYMRGLAQEEELYKLVADQGGPGRDIKTE